MTITLDPETEARLKQRANETGQDINDLASNLIADALDDPDNLSSREVAEIRLGIRNGLDDAAAGRERPLNKYVAAVMRRR